MTPGKDQIVLHASTQFKDALGAYATEHGEAMAEVIRKAVSAYIGYDISVEPARTRTPKYASPADKKNAEKTRAALLRWGRSATSRLLAQGEIEPATILARAVNNKDYETLLAVRNAAGEADREDDEVEETESEETEENDDNGE